MRQIGRWAGARDIEVEGEMSNGFLRNRKNAAGVTEGRREKKSRKEQKYVTAD